MDAWDEVNQFLSSPGAYGDLTQVEIIDTSISKVFLSGNCAYKIRKPIKLSYLDFSTLEKRYADCLREVTLNRRTAPSIYLGVIAVTRESDTKLAIEGQGPPVEWMVKMRRFDSAALLERMAEAGTLDTGLITKLACAIAAFHESIPPEYTPDVAASFQEIVRLIDTECRQFAENIFPLPAIEALRDQQLARLTALAPLMNARKTSGWVRHCHGDLHLGNIFCLDGEPTPFDCIEFSDSLAKIDILYDLAFLLMDLWQRGLLHHANRCLNQYLAHLAPQTAAACIEGLVLLPLFLSCRAGVRAFVMARTSQSKRDNTNLKKRSVDYFHAAQKFLRPARAELIAVSGLSGSGKSMLARALAPGIGAAPGAVILRSDEIRKTLAGIPLLKALPASAYTPQNSEQVYACILSRAHAALLAGHSVIVDAVYSRADERAAIETVARDLGVPFQGYWLRAPYDVLLRRVNNRRDDASDANASVVQRQQDYDTGRMDWTEVDASGTPSETLQRVLSQKHA